MVKLETLLGTGYSSKYGEPVHARLYVGGGTKLLCEHGGCTGYLILYMKGIESMKYAKTIRAIGMPLGE